VSEIRSGEVVEGRRLGRGTGSPVQASRVRARPSVGRDGRPTRLRARLLIVGHPSGELPGAQAVRVHGMPLDLHSEGANALNALSPLLRRTLAGVCRAQLGAPSSYVALLIRRGPPGAGFATPLRGASARS
jgi:hypothetical protein